MSFFKFTPDLSSKEDLEFISVGREQIIQDVIKKIKSATTNNLATHVLFVGQRGIGKTNTILRLYHKLHASKKFTTVRLSEEEYSITTVENLLQRILEELAIPFDDANIEQVALDTFKKLKKQKQFPIIFVDNLQMLFEQMRNDLPKLRSILQEYNPFCIISSALTVFFDISSYDEPFYNFMDIRFLKGLNTKQTKELIKKRLDKSSKEISPKDFHQYEQRIIHLQLLTGGNPRLIHSLCEILLQKDSLADLETNLFMLLDSLTPYYQARMEHMPVIQRKLVDVLSQQKGPISPTQLSTIAKMKTPNVITQLRRLESSGIVESIKFREKKETSYQITERLYRIWREMRSPVGTKRISLFVDFLSIWYTTQERVLQYEEIWSNFVSEIPVSIDKTKQNLVQLCYLSDSIPHLKVLDFSDLIDQFAAIGDHDSIDQEIRQMEKRRDDTTSPIIKEIINLSLTHTKHRLSRILKKPSSIKNFQKECDKLENKIVELSNKFKDNPNASERVWLHDIYRKLVWHYASKDIEKTIKYFDLLVSFNDDDADSLALEKSMILMFQQKYSEALSVLSKITNKDKNTKISELGCLVMMNQSNDAQRIALELIDDGLDDITQIITTLSLNLTTTTLLIVKKAISKLDDYDKNDQKKFATQIGLGFIVIFFTNYSVSQHVIIEKLFNIFNELYNKYNADVLDIGLYVVDRLFSDGDEQRAELFLNRILLINEKFKDELYPLTVTMDYLKTGNTDVLEKTHKEVRGLVIELIEEMVP